MIPLDSIVAINRKAISYEIKKTDVAGTSALRFNLQYRVCSILL